MHRPLTTIIGAPSSIGIRPYDDTGKARHLDRAPSVFRELGLVERLGAHDAGDVVPPPYQDFVRPPGRARNEQGVVQYSYALAKQVTSSLERQQFVVVLGGDCSTILGCLLGARSMGNVGLVYVDAHADFATPAESRTGSVASMCLAMAVGRGDTPLARLDGVAPLVQPQHVVLLGRRDHAEPRYGHAALAVSGVLDIPESERLAHGTAAMIHTALARLDHTSVGRFWIHVDADVLNPNVMPAVDSPEAGGPSMDELAALLAPLVRHPRALGMNITIYDPALDPDRACATKLVELLEHLLGRTS